MLLIWSFQSCVTAFIQWMKVVIRGGGVGDRNLYLFLKNVSGVGCEWPPWSFSSCRWTPGWWRLTPSQMMLWLSFCVVFTHSWCLFSLLSKNLFISLWCSLLLSYYCCMRCHTTLQSSSPFFRVYQALHGQERSWRALWNLHSCITENWLLVYSSNIVSVSDGNIYSMFNHLCTWSFANK